MPAGYKTKPAIVDKNQNLAVQEDQSSKDNRKLTGQASTGEALPDGQNSSKAPVVQVVNALIEQGAYRRASDIHIEPGEYGVRIRYRIDGILTHVTTLPLNMLNALVSRIKIIADLDIAEKRIPQDGRIQQKINGREIDIRVSTFPTVFGEKLVLRLLDKNTHFLKLEDLGFSCCIRETIRHLLAKPIGMTLSSGPTGSGKTTSLYAMLNELNSVEKNVITLEDPVEYLFEGINQTSINLRAGLTFPAGLRSILRQDPDIIMVGEIRDLETAQIAVRAANTGHLLLSTLHTNDAPSALTRLMDMGIEPFLIASSVHAIIGQRLVRRICRTCIEEYQMLPGALERKLLGIDTCEGFVTYRGRGCNACGNTGYLGRVAVAEVLPVTEAVGRMVVGKASSTAIKEYVTAHEGFVPMLEDGLSKVREGITTLEEIIRCL